TGRQKQSKAISFWQIRPDNFIGGQYTRTDERLYVIYIAAVIGGMSGSVVLYVLLEGIVKFWSSSSFPDLLFGKTVLGGLIGGYAGVELAKKALGYTRPTGDLFAPMVAVAILVARLGCLSSGCCPGIEIGPVWYGMRDGQGVTRFPAVPLEMLFNFIAVIGLLMLRKSQAYRYQHFHIYLVSYGAFRFFHEFFRDTIKIVGPLSGYHLASLALVFFGLFRAWRFTKLAPLGST
ncbi:MAG: prolipoprotein diacylglyceryl transferase, partial [Bdellovibrionales bacterium]|nr:prolipoprotein diacylglyceryl transferase [Bdellovibrionales bacterium]